VHEPAEQGGTAVERAAQGVEVLAEGGKVRLPPERDKAEAEGAAKEMPPERDKRGGGISGSPRVADSRVENTRGGTAEGATCAVCVLYQGAGVLQD